MTTPQSILFDFHYKLNDLIKSFNSGDEDVFESIERTLRLLENLDERISRMEHTLTLLLEVYSKEKNVRK